MEAAQRAIVTGADSGIGKATAVTLAARGFDVGFTWYDDERGARGTADEVRARGARAALVEADFEHAERAGTAVRELADELGGVDVLVNNAGTGHSTPFLELDLPTWRRVVEVDLTAAFVAAQEAARRMVAAGRGGRIVNVTSVHEHIPLRGASAYCAAKGGLGLLTKVMALELAERGIAVNAVAPGAVATPMTDMHDQDPHEIELPAIPARRPASAHEIAAAIAFLACSGAATYTTGTSLVVDGGLMLKAAEQG